MVIVLAMVLVIMVVMNAVMFYVLRTTAILTRKQVSACFVRELEDYDQFLDEQDEENRQLLEEREDLRKEISDMQGVMTSLKSSPFYAPRPVPRDLFVPTARYIDNDFFENHKRVKDLMKGFDKLEVMGRIREKLPYEGNLAEYEAASRILDMLDLNTLYELGTMSEPVQLQVLEESFEGMDKELLERYVSEQDREKFDCLDFVSWLKELRTYQDPRMYVRTGDRDDDFSPGGEDVVTQYDGNISEGIKFIHQNMLFDFSIYRLRSKK